MLEQVLPIAQMKCNVLCSMLELKMFFLLYYKYKPNFLPLLSPTENLSRRRVSLGSINFFLLRIQQEKQHVSEHFEDWFLLKGKVCELKSSSFIHPRLTRGIFRSVDHSSNKQSLMVYRNSSMSEWWIMPFYS